MRKYIEQIIFTPAINASNGECILVVVFKTKDIRYQLDIYTSEISFIENYGYHINYFMNELIRFIDVNELFIDYDTQETIRKSIINAFKEVGIYEEPKTNNGTEPF